MISHEIRQQLQNIVRGNDLEGQEDHCTAVRNLLSQSFGSNPTVKGEFESRSIIKKEEAGFLKILAERRKIWIPSLPEDFVYLTRGGESKVFLAPDRFHVIKVNDAVYYATWTEFFNSLVIHNLLFPNTAYELLGFVSGEEKQLNAILKQRFIEGGQAELINRHCILHNAKPSRIRLINLR